MAILEMTREDIFKIRKAQSIVEEFESILEKNGFEFFIEGENMLLKTIDGENVYRLYDKSMGNHSDLNNSVIILPRINDAQDLVPVKLNGKDPIWK